jgi:hypothetical protein
MTNDEDSPEVVANMSRLITATAFLLFVLAGLATAQDRTTFTVGTATAARGQKATAR